MLVTIGNARLQVQISPLGAEMMRVTGSDGTEYLWDGNPAYWGNRATNLFPYVGRLTDKRYTVGGQSYSMDIHGFLRVSQTSPKDAGAQSISFELRENPETLKQYPFPFLMGVHYRLEESSLFITYSVANTGEKPMYFGLGGHPGFRVPLEPGLRFEDYALDFGGACRRVPLSADCFILEGQLPFELDGGRFLPLRHGLFDNDALILHCPGRRVTLASPRGKRFVTLSHPDMPWLGVWHRPKSDAPYVCLEPWVSLPSRKGVVEDLSTHPGLVRLMPGSRYENEWSLTFG